MSVIRWLFGRSTLNRADMIVIIALVVALPWWWASLIGVVLWTVISLTIERLVFGPDYPERSAAYQALAEDWDE